MYRIVAFLCSVSITLTTVTPIYATAIPLPYLPYVDPSIGQVLDIINNAYGLIAPAIEDKTKKVEAYYTLYKDAVGAGFDAFWDDVVNVVERAKTSRKIEISAGLQGSLMKGFRYQLEHGFVYETGETITTTQAAKNWIVANTLVTDSMLSVDMMDEVAEYNNAQEPYRIICTTDSYNQVYVFIFGTEQVVTISNLNTPSSPMWRISASIGQNWQAIFVNTNSGSSQKSTYQRNGAFISNAGAEVIELSEIGTAQVPIVAQDSDVSAAIANDTATVLTADTELNMDGTVDDTKPITITLPQADIVPATDIADLPAVQETLNVTPATTTEDVTTQVQDLQQAVAELREANDYALDLTQYFPFCLPFDIARILEAFVAEPEAPHIVYSFRNPFYRDSDNEANSDSNTDQDTSDEQESAEGLITIDIDLSIFNGVASVLRTLETILFVIGLAVVTRQLYLRG